MNLARKARRVLGRAARAVGLRPPATPGPGGQPAPDELGGAFDERLRSMRAGDEQLGADGQRHPIDKSVGIGPSQGLYLYDLCRSLRPAATLEVGLAYGYSTIYFLAGHAANGSGSHTAIDPCQTDYWHGIGAAHARALCQADGPAFRLIEDRSDQAFAGLAAAGSRFGVIFIDGNHRFDDILVDFYLYSQLTTVGGYVVLDDIWMSSTQSVAAFIRANRVDFTEVESDEPNIAVFKKVSEDVRDWRNFRRFAVSRDSD